MAISEDCLLGLTPQSDEKQGVSHLQGKHCWYQDILTCYPWQSSPALSCTPADFASPEQKNTIGFGLRTPQKSLGLFQTTSMEVSSLQLPGCVAGKHPWQTGKL